MLRRATPLTLLCLSLLAGLTWLAYAPGLHGGFLFDDYGNLPALGASGPIDRWPTFWRYITSGIADPTGRPLTLLTFLLDAQDWPAAPYPFKRTNLILHVINGVLLALLLGRLGRETFKSSSHQRVDLAAALGAGFWLLHPLFVSTTMYIVQREAILPTTFTLLGLLAWLRGRHAAYQGQVKRGLGWIALGLAGCTLLGLLSKANGILLPALALVVEYVLLRAPTTTSVPSAPSPQQVRGRTIYQRSMLVFAWLPATAVAGYLLEQGWNGITRGITTARPWTLVQRLLTEPRVLLDYLDLLWLPRPFTPGLFNDQVKASVSLWSPASTLPALATVLGLIAIAWLLRRRRPVWALAILFYFVGQSLESSTIPLELYFEHRNYLPAMLMFWPLALWLCGVSANHLRKPSITSSGEAVSPGLPTRGQYVSNNARFALAALILSGLGVMTHARASLWGNEHDQALLWAKLNPASPRAQANAAMVEMNAGQPAQAVTRLREPLTKSPDQVQLALNLFGAQCQLGSVDSATLVASRKALRTARDPGSLLVSWFERAMGQLGHPPCPQLNVTTLADMLQAAQSNPNLKENTGRQQDIDYLKGRLALIQGNANDALAQFNHALDLQPRTSIALKQAALLGASGFPQQGLAHLEHLRKEPARALKPGLGMPQIHAWVLRSQDYWPKELARLRATLQNDALQQTRAAQ